MKKSEEVLNSIVLFIMHAYEFDDVERVYQLSKCQLRTACTSVLHDLDRGVSIDKKKITDICDSLILSFFDCHVVIGRDSQQEKNISVSDIYDAWKSAFLSEDLNSEEHELYIKYKEILKNLLKSKKKGKRKFSEYSYPFGKIDAFLEPYSFFFGAMFSDEINKALIKRLSDSVFQLSNVALASTCDASGTGMSYTNLEQGLISTEVYSWAKTVRDISRFVRVSLGSTSLSLESTPSSTQIFAVTAVAQRIVGSVCCWEKLSSLEKHMKFIRMSGNEYSKTNRSFNFQFSQLHNLSTIPSANYANDLQMNQVRHYIILCLCGVILSSSQFSQDEFDTVFDLCASPLIAYEGSIQSLSDSMNLLFEQAGLIDILKSMQLFLAKYNAIYIKKVHLISGDFSSCLSACTYLYPHLNSLHHLLKHKDLNSNEKDKIDQLESRIFVEIDGCFEKDEFARTADLYEYMGLPSSQTALDKSSAQHYYLIIRLVAQSLFSSSCQEQAYLVMYYHYNALLSEINFLDLVPSDKSIAYAPSLVVDTLVSLGEKQLRTLSYPSINFFTNKDLVDSKNGVYSIMSSFHDLFCDHFIYVFRVVSVLQKALSENPTLFITGHKQMLCLLYQVLVFFDLNLPSRILEDHPLLSKTHKDQYQFKNMIHEYETLCKENYTKDVFLTTKFDELKSALHTFNSSTHIKFTERLQSIASVYPLSSAPGTTSVTYAEWLCSSGDQSLFEFTKHDIDILFTDLRDLLRERSEDIAIQKSIFMVTQHQSQGL